MNISGSGNITKIDASGISRAALPIKNGASINHGYEPQSKLRGIVPCLCRIIRLTNFNAPIVTFRLFAFEIGVSQ